MSWIEQAKRVPVRHVAAELGLELRSRTLGPCPACGAEARGRHDRRLPIGPTDNGMGWKCHACGRTGSVVDLAGHALKIEPCTADARSWWAARGWCEPGRQAQPPPRVKPRPPPPTPPHKPALDPVEAQTLWERCIPVGDHEGVRDWLQWERGLDVGQVEDRDLARALPASLPPWASHWPHQGVDCVLPLCDATGTVVGLRGRQTRRARGPKSSAMRGVRSAGMVFADGAARALLSGKTWVAEAGPASVVVAEGGPDWLTWSTRTGDCESAPAVIGIPGSGAWTLELAAQIPDGATVYVLTHHDQAGDAYARQIIQSLGLRCVVRRRRADG